MNMIALRATGLPTISARNPQDRAVAKAVERLEIVSDTASFLELEPYWDDLLERCAVQTPFMRWDWVNLWRQECIEKFDLAVGVVRDVSGKPIAIAPLVLAHGAEGARKHLRLLTFAGCVGNVTTEGMDFLIPTGEEAEYAPILSRIFAQLRDRWDAVQLPMMHEESASLPHIRAALAECGTGFALINRLPSHYMSLPASWAEVEQRHGSNWRSNHRRKWKKMHETYQGRALLGGKDKTPSESFDVLLDLHSRRWTEDESVFVRPEVVRFHRRLVDKWVPEGRLMITMLELEGAPAAASYNFADFGRLWFYQAGWNDKYSSISIGKLSTAWIVHSCIAQGLKELDFLPGDISYKREWSDHVRYVVDVEAFNPMSLRALAFRGLRSVKRRLRPVQVTPPEAVKGDDA